MGHHHVFVFRHVSSSSVTERVTCKTMGSILIITHGKKGTEKSFFKKERKQIQNVDRRGEIKLEKGEKEQQN